MAEDKKKFVGSKEKKEEITENKDKEVLEEVKEEISLEDKLMEEKPKEEPKKETPLKIPKPKKGERMVSVPDGTTDPYGNPNFKFVPESFVSKFLKK